MACGQQSASGFAKRAIERLLKEHAGSRVRLSTPRGNVRIVGVAGGQFDLALVSDTPEMIQRVARIEMYIESLFEDCLVLVANPSAKSDWDQQWHDLATDRAVTARELVGLPFILPERDAARRRQFDEWAYRSTGRALDVVLETGGWQTIMSFALSGVGVGLVSQNVAEHFLDGLDMIPAGHDFHSVVRELDTRSFPVSRIHLISRKKHKHSEPDVTPLGMSLIEMLRAAVSPAQCGST